MAHASQTIRWPWCAPATPTRSMGGPGGAGSGGGTTSTTPITTRRGSATATLGTLVNTSPPTPRHLSSRYIPDTPRDRAQPQPASGRFSDSRGRFAGSGVGPRFHALSIWDTEKVVVECERGAGRRITFGCGRSRVGIRRDSLIGHLSGRASCRRVRCAPVQRSRVAGSAAQDNIDADRAQSTRWPAASSEASSPRLTTRCPTRGAA